MSKNFNITVKTTETTAKGFMKTLYNVAECDYEDFCVDFMHKLFPELYADELKQKAEAEKKAKLDFIESELRRLNELRNEIERKV